MSEGFAQGPYVADGVGFEPATLRTEGTALTTEGAILSAFRIFSNDDTNPR